MTIPHTSLRGCCPIIQLPHATTTTAPKSAALSIPDTSLSGPLFVHSTAMTLVVKDGKVYSRMDPNNPNCPLTNVFTVGAGGDKPDNQSNTEEQGPPALKKPKYH